MIRAVRGLLHRSRPDGPPPCDRGDGRAGGPRRDPGIDHRGRVARFAVRGRTGPGRPARPSRTCKSTFAASPIRTPSCAEPRPRRSPSCATRRRRCSTSSPIVTSWPPRCCPSSAPSTPGSGRSPIWRVAGPFAIDASPSIDATKPIDLTASFEGAEGRHVTWRSVKPVNSRGQVDLGRTYSHKDDLAAYGYAEIQSPVERRAQMVVGSDDTLTVWLNGKQVYNFADSRGFVHEHARFDMTLNKGANKLLIRCGNHGGAWQYAIAVTAPIDFAFLKATSGEGFNPDVYRSLCAQGARQPDRGAPALRRLEGPGLHQVPRRRQGRGRRRAGALERRVQVPPRRADRCRAVSLRQDRLGLRAERPGPPRRPRPHRDRPQRDRGRPRDPGRRRQDVPRDQG